MMRCDSAMNTYCRPPTDANTMSCGWRSPVTKSDTCPFLSSSTFPVLGCETSMFPSGVGAMNRARLIRA
jgi:hypothetical protein